MSWIFGVMGFFGNFTQLSQSPQVYVCEHFLSDEECDHLIEIAKGSLKRTTVLDLSGGGNSVDSRRTSLGTWLTVEDDVVKNINHRIAEVTQIPIENGECIQMLYYGVGAEYQPHFDYFDPRTNGGRQQLERGGQRVATFMVYLNTVEAGGETIYPKINLKITPEKGKAVLFYNVTQSGAVDPMSFHGGAPVKSGEKWLMTRWLREGEFH
jgi:prolyl 4-hydroxylase